MNPARRPLSFRLRVAGLAVVLGVALLLAGSAAAAPPITIALLPMVVHSAERPEYLREGLADMLSSRLDRVEGLEVTRIEDADQATSRLTQALDFGREAGVDFVLFGSFTRFGQGASLDVQCAATQVGNTQAPLREIFVHSGSIGDVIPDLDDLVGKVARFVDRGVAEGTTLAVGQQPEGSPESIEELRDRVNALEKALAELTPGPGANAVAAPSATAEAAVR